MDNEYTFYRFARSHFDAADATLVAEFRHAITGQTISLPLQHVALAKMQEIKGDCPDNYDHVEMIWKSLAIKQFHEQEPDRVLPDAVEALMAMLPVNIETITKKLLTGISNKFVTAIQYIGIDDVLPHAKKLYQFEIVFKGSTVAYSYYFNEATLQAWQNKIVGNFSSFPKNSIAQQLCVLDDATAAMPIIPTPAPLPR